jgi:adenylosuccinate lyase
MIERYAIPEMTAIWADESRFARWLEIEVLAVEARCIAGLVPPEDYELIRSRASFDVDRINSIEMVTHHDVIAFLTSVAESLGPESRHIHYGMTSSDILDTCLATQFRDAGRLIGEALDAYGEALASLVRRSVGIPCIGRTHGMHAEPTTMALKFAGHYCEYLRCSERLSEALKSVCTGTISGAVGTYAHLDPSVEEHVCAALGIGFEPAPTQIVARDRHAQFLYALAAVGGALERFATETRHLQRTEVGEVEESFARGQKGSSAMPHKKNPIIGERLCGFARLLRGYLATSLENTALWHERDISHSSAERFIFPDACGVALYALKKAADLAGGLVIDRKAVQRNLELSGDRFHSQALMLLLTNRGVTRERAYGMIQDVALNAVKQVGSFLEAARRSPEISGVLTADEIEHACDMDIHSGNEKRILKRLGLD